GRGGPGGVVLAAAALPEGPHPDLPRPGVGSVGRGLEHHPVEDRDRFRRLLRSGLGPGFAVAPELRARAHHRLHLRRALGGVRLAWRRHRARPVPGGGGTLPVDRRRLARRLRKAAGGRTGPGAVRLRAGQRRHDLRPAAGGRRADAAAELRRHRGGLAARGHGRGDGRARRPARARPLNARQRPVPRRVERAGRVLTSPPMNRRPRPLAPGPRQAVLAVPLLLLAACANSNVHPPATPAGDAPVAVEPAPPLPAQAVPGRLPPVPQPPERPVAPPSVTDPALPRETRIANFVDYTADTYGIDREHIRRVLAGAEHRQPIIDAMSRPAEAVRPWRDYRPIFINDARIAGGRAFYATHRAALDRVAAETGVPAEYIVAIIGVETSYGRVTGNHRVLDALYTLAFGFPKLAPFFAGELAQLFALAAEEPQLDITALRGSYAGAMGMGQFMPSS